jgi:hypothetical protein
MSKAVKIYETMVKLVACGSETGPVAEMDTKRLNTWERKILSTMYGPVVEQGIWRIRINQELGSCMKIQT